MTLHAIFIRYEWELNKVHANPWQHKIEKDRSVFTELTATSGTDFSTSIRGKAKKLETVNEKIFEDTNRDIM